MILTVISSPYVYGLEYGFDYPDEVLSGEEFEVVINSDTTDQYDVKIYVYDDVKEFSEIYDGNAWKTTFYYLKGVFPDQTTFKVRAHYEGETEICVKLRKTGETSNPDILCDNIRVLAGDSGGGDGSQSDGGDSGNDEDERNENDSEDGSPSEGDSGLEDDSFGEDTGLGGDPYLSEKIVLNYPVDNSAEVDDDKFMSKQEKVRLWIVYGFVFLCLAIIVLLALRKL